MALTAMPPFVSLRVQCLRQLGYNPNFKHPRSFNEHIQARKLYDRDPRFAPLSDKVKVKDYVRERIGEQFIIPTLWSGRELPQTPPWPTPFVVKSNHSSGWNIFVLDHDPAEWSRTRVEAAAWLKKDWHPFLHEWWYNEIDRQILVEPMIGEDPLDYKFFVFDGKVALIQVDFGRHTDHTRSLYSKNWELEPFALTWPRHPHPLPRPKHFEEMIRLAEILGGDFSFVRVDFYHLDSGPLFGEMTFSPEAGLGRFDPPEYDLRLGALWPGG